MIHPDLQPPILRDLLWSSNFINAVADEEFGLVPGPATLFLAISEYTSGLAVSSTDLKYPSYVFLEARDSPVYQSVRSRKLSK